MACNDNRFIIILSLYKWRTWGWLDWVVLALGLIHRHNQTACRQSEWSRGRWRLARHPGSSPVLRLSPHGPSVWTFPHSRPYSGQKDCFPGRWRLHRWLFQEERCKAASPLMTKPQKSFSDNAATVFWCTPVTSPTIFKRRGFRLPLGGKWTRL